MRLSGIALLLATSTAVADDELDVPGLDSSDLRGDAMIWEDAPIYLEPSESSVSFRFNQFTRKLDVGRAVSVRIVDSSLKNFVEIAATNRGDCTWRKLEVDNRLEGLRMFVRREDLAPVLVKPYETKWSDGTRMKLGIGIPVTPTTTGDYAVSLKKDKIRLSIPHASVGYVYKAGKIADPEPGKDKLALLPMGTNVKFGDDGFQVRSTWYVLAPDKKTDNALVTLRARCVDAIVEAPITNIRVVAPQPMRTTPPPPPAPVTGWKIPAGTPLMTPSGREVAVAGLDISVQMPAPAPEQVCFDARFNLRREDELYQDQSRTLRLCATGSAVTK